MIILITGDHLRHFYQVDNFIKTFDDIVWIIEKRESIIPRIDKNYSKNIQKLQKIHFYKRYEAEKKFFGHKAGNISKSKIKKIFEITHNDFYNGKLKKIIKLFDPQLLITYGCHKIPEEILNIIKNYKWNIHGGLSPWYRGVITHFWPSYLLEPQFTGMTLHELTKDIDGGNIIHQSSSKVNINDGIHENACRVVKDFSKTLPVLLNKKLKKKNKLLGIKSSTTGRIWTSKMWTPMHLKIIYEVFYDKINKFCLENYKIKKPSIKSILIN